MTAIREARVVLPIDNHHRMPKAHALLHEGLIDAFGGVTTQEVNGAWKDPSGRVIREPGIAYDVAMQVTGDNVMTLIALAVAAGKMADQKCMYVRLPDGTVEFLMISETVGA